MNNKCIHVKFQFLSSRNYRCTNLSSLFFLFYQFLQKIVDEFKRVSNSFKDNLISLTDSWQIAYDLLETDNSNVEYMINWLINNTTNCILSVSRIYNCTLSLHFF